MSRSYIPYRSERISLRGELGELGITGPTGFQGVDPIGPTGFIGEMGSPGPTCLCYLGDKDFIDVEVTGATGGEGLFYVGESGAFKNMSLQVLASEIDFSEIPTFTGTTGALSNLGSGKLWINMDEPNVIRLTPYIYPVAYWDFEEGSGSLVRDFGKPSRDNNATINVATSVVDFTSTGVLSNLGTYALDFKSTATSRVTGSDVGLPDKVMTISIWFKTTITSNQIPFYYGTDGVGFGKEARMIQLASSGTLLIWGSDKGGTWITKGGLTMADGNWHHIVATHDGSASKLYFDGNLETSGVPSEAFDTLNPDQVYIGGSRSSFRGQLDDVAVFDRVLTDDQVSYLWNNGNGNLAKYIVE